MSVMTVLAVWIVVIMVIRKVVLAEAVEVSVCVGLTREKAGFEVQTTSVKPVVGSPTSGKHVRADTSHLATRAVMDVTAE